MPSSGRLFVVLGGGGFLGINLTRRLVAAGVCVRAFGHARLFTQACRSSEFRHGDFSDRAALADALRGTEIAFHLVHSTVPYTA